MGDGFLFGVWEAKEHRLNQLTQAVSFSLKAEKIVDILVQCHQMVSKLPIPVVVINLDIDFPGVRFLH